MTEGMRQGVLMFSMMLLRRQACLVVRCICHADGMSYLNQCLGHTLTACIRETARNLCLGGHSTCRRCVT